MWKNWLLVYSRSKRRCKRIHLHWRRRQKEKSDWNRGIIVWEINWSEITWGIIKILSLQNEEGWCNSNASQ